MKKKRIYLAYWRSQFGEVNYKANAMLTAIYVKLEIRSVEHGICPIAEFTNPWLNCAAILAIRP